MKKIKGIPVSEGIAIGKAVVYRKEKIKIKKRKIDPKQTKTELEKYHKAVLQELQEVQDIIDNYLENEKEKELISSYKLILKDPLMEEKITEMIEDRLFTAEFALKNYLDEVSQTFAKMTNKYFSERVSDYENTIARLIDHLNGNENHLEDEIFNNRQQGDYIYVLDDISPSQVAKSYQGTAQGLCLAKGSKTSHTAIISRALGLPVVVGIENLFEKIQPGDDLLLNGYNGEIVINPDEAAVKKYQSLLKEENRQKAELEKTINIPAQTADGKKIPLYCNIELEQEIDTVIKKKADGIGLFRTEYLYVDRKDLPQEDEQFEVYRNIAEKMKDKPVIIRTYDLGGDKLAGDFHRKPESNPFLGCRGIRLSLKEPEVFKTQIKALLRANKYGNIMVMFPMVSSAYEVSESIKIIEYCKEELRQKNIEHNPDIKLGAMIEIPAAVFCIAELANLCDFFSLGTNDLVQYTLAADRINKEVERYYNPYHPSILKMINITVANAHRFKKPVSICGEIASDPDFIPLLIGSGVDSLSLNPASLLAVKKKVSECSFQEAKKMVRKVLTKNCR